MPTGFIRIAAIQNEYSLLYRIEAEETLHTTRGLGIAFVAYAPLGRGLLTAKIEEPAGLAETDTRRRHPRFAAANLAHNVELVQRIEAIARTQGLHAGTARAGVAARPGDDIIPIPGTKRKERLVENLGRPFGPSERKRRPRDFSRDTRGVGRRHALS